MNICLVTVSWINCNPKEKCLDATSCFKNTILLSKEEKQKNMVSLLQSFFLKYYIFQPTAENQWLEINEVGLLETWGSEEHACTTKSKVYLHGSVPETSERQRTNTVCLPTPPPSLLQLEKPAACTQSCLKTKTMQVLFQSQLSTHPSPSSNPSPSHPPLWEEKGCLTMDKPGILKGVPISPW